MTRLHSDVRTDEPAWLCLAPALLLIPFLGKAFNVDDPQFITHARLIAESPWAPYRQVVLWDRHNVPLFDFAHPLLWQMGLAAVRSVAGESEIALQLCTVAAALAALLAMRGLARSLGVSPFVACCLFGGSSTFIVTATSVMPDMAMAALGLGALHLVVRATETDDRRLAALSGACAAGAFLCRFSAAFVLPLLVAYPIFRRRFGPSLWLPAVTALAGVGAYEAWSTAQMGTPHFLHALALWSNPIDLDRAMRFPFFLAAFLGAQLPPTGIALYAVGARGAGGRAAVVGSLALAVVVSLVLENDGTLLVMALLFTWPTLALMADAAARLLRAIRIGSAAPSSREALVWTCALGLCTVAFATISHAHVAAKYSLLPLGFATLLLLTALKESAGPRSSVTRIWLPASVAATCAIGFAAGLSDARWGNTYREFFASGAHRPFLPASGRLVVNADWGFRYYAEKAGLSVYTGAPLAAGDRLMRTAEVAPAMPIRDEPPALIAEIPLRYPGPLALMNSRAHAGFFSHGWGPYPFTPQRDVVDRVFVFGQ